MSTRKPLSAESLEKLANARAKALEKKKQLKEQRLREQEKIEEVAKNEILEEQDAEPLPNPPKAPKPQPDPEDEEEEILPKKSRKTKVPSLDLDYDDLSVIKEFLQTTKVKRKAEKWEARKAEVADEVIRRLSGYEEVQQTSVPVYGGLSLFDD